MGCCETQKNTFSSSLVGADWQKSGLNYKKHKSLDIALLSPTTNKISTLCVSNVFS